MGTSGPRCGRTLMISLLIGLAFYLGFLFEHFKAKQNLLSVFVGFQGM